MIIGLCVMRCLSLALIQIKVSIGQPNQISNMTRSSLTVEAHKHREHRQAAGDLIAVRP